MERWTKLWFILYRDFLEGYTQPNFEPPLCSLPLSELVGLELIPWLDSSLPPSPRVSPRESSSASPQIAEDLFILSLYFTSDRIFVFGKVGEKEATKWFTTLQATLSPVRSCSPPPLSPSSRKDKSSSSVLLEEVGWVGASGEKKEEKRIGAALISAEGRVALWGRVLSGDGAEFVSVSEPEIFKFLARKFVTEVVTFSSVCLAVVRVPGMDDLRFVVRNYVTFVKIKKLLQKTESFRRNIYFDTPVLF